MAWVIINIIKAGGLLYISSRLGPLLNKVGGHFYQLRWEWVGGHFYQLRWVVIYIIKVGSLLGVGGYIYH